MARTEPEHTDELFSRATRLTVESRRPFDSARVWLRFGQWQRRSRRPGAATASLLRALEIFDYLGAERWAGVARADLRAAGHPIGQGPADRSPPDGDGALTPQQWRIVRLAARGLTNRQIAVKLSISPRTVGHHLYQAYPKLGVTSRGRLAEVLRTATRTQSRD